MRPQQAPWDYECPYRDRCPHLGWQSTQWVFSEYEQAYDEHCEHWKVREIQQEQLDHALKKVAQLEKENERLQAKLSAIHQKQFKSNKRSKRNSEKAGHLGDMLPKSKKRGAPRGHPGWFRSKPEQVDRTIYVSAPEQCPHCNCADLTPLEKIEDHLQEDIVLQPRTCVTNFRHGLSFCPQCNRAVIQATEGELLNCHIGPVTKAAAVYLRYGLHLPYRKVQELFQIFFDMPFVPASAMAFDRTATKKGEPLYEDLLEKVRVAASIHADETSWRQDGKGHYVWYAGNQDLGVFHIDRHRSSEVAQTILGDNFRGILNTDGYAAYNAVNAKDRQSCLAHLIRKAEDIKKEILLKKKRFQDGRAIRFCDAISKLFRKACDINRKTNESDIKSGRAQARIKRLYSLLNIICLTPLADKDAEAFRKRLLDPKKEYHRLFTFLKYQEVQPTNNQAEQSLRSMVIFRKVCFGTRSPDGSRAHSVLPSLVLTAQRQSRHPLQFLQTLFTSDTAVAQKALYNNSS